MANNPLLIDRCWDTTTTTGTGTLTLSGTAKVGYQTFGAGVGNGNACTYCISDTTNGAWEVGIGTYTSSGTTLSRDVILASSNAGSAVSLAAGTKDVVSDLPADFIVCRQAVVSSSFNLWVANNVSSPNTEIDLKVGPFGSVFQVVLEDIASPANTFKMVVNSTITINAGTTGVNGLDTGAQASSTWYYIWAIAKSDTSASAGLLSLSGSNPTMPTGYTYKALLGQVFSGGTTHFQTFNQYGMDVYTPVQNVFTNQAATSANTYQSQSISTIVPVTAKSWGGIFGSSLSANGAQMRIAADSSGTAAQQVTIEIGATSLFQTYFGASSFDGIPLLTAQTFFWMALNTNAANRVDVTRWRY